MNYNRNIGFRWPEKKWEAHYGGPTLKKKKKKHNNIKLIFTVQRSLKIDREILWSLLLLASTKLARYIPLAVLSLRNRLSEPGVNSHSNLINYKLHSPLLGFEPLSATN